MKRTRCEVDIGAPRASIIEKLDREIEDGEFTAWRLEKLVSKKEVDEAIKA